MHGFETIIETFLNGFPQDGLNSATCCNYAALLFKNSGFNVTKIDLRIAFLQGILREHFKRDAECLKRSQAMQPMRISFARHPEHTATMKERRLHTRCEVLPLLQRLNRPPRIEFICTIANSDNAGFIAGAGAAISGTVGIQQHDRLTRSHQSIGDPDTKYA